MEEVFSILFAETNDTQSFENSLEKNFQAIYDFFNAPYQIQYKHKEDIEHFILLKNKDISGSSFQKDHIGSSVRIHSLNSRIYSPYPCSSSSSSVTLDLS